MRTKLIALLAGAAFATGAWSQADPDRAYNGKWAATIVAADGKPMVSQLDLRGFAGTWSGTVGRAADGKRACNSKKVPVTVQASNDHELSFTVWGTSIAPGCKDLTIETRPVAENTFEGTVVDVGTIRIVRR